MKDIPESLKSGAIQWIKKQKKKDLTDDNAP